VKKFKTAFGLLASTWAPKRPKVTSEKQLTETILALHDREMRLVREPDTNVRVWQLVVTLMRYCRDESVSFRGIVEEAEEFVAGDQPEVPKC
jgi:hypothetical protein